ncbi:MAG: type II toxin-antitoxin system VapC family toxin [Myxococcota bacterium]|nr:type II toxin-antitoxin system VapC family toxin [Myxococcota bacterium]
MNVVDSSGWLEFFADGPNASHFELPIKDVEKLVVPSISIYEVFKVLLREAGENAALQGVAAMSRATVVELTTALAMSAAKLSLLYTLPMADAIMLATANSQNAILWTQDADFKGLPSVEYVEKQ